MARLPPRPDLYLPLVPGLLLGIHLGGLLFFLNPHLPFTAGAVARGALGYGILGSLVGAALLVPWVWNQPRRARRLLPWWITGALVVAAAIDSYHASRFAYFLPPGINERLIKTALLLAAAALVAFYTALLHSLHRRPYGVRSRVAFVLLSLASVYVVIERREAFDPPEDRARPTAIAQEERPHLLVVGLDTATLDALLPMAEGGRLPFLARALREGAYGRLASFGPHRPDALWATVATGKFPYKHGALGEPVRSAPFLGSEARLRLLPAGLGFRRWAWRNVGAAALGRGDRRDARALWEILPRLGLSTGVIGWPTVDPGEGTPRYVLGAGFFDASAAEAADADEAASSAALAERARTFRLVPADLEPRLAERLAAAPPDVARALAGDLWRSSYADFLGREEPVAGVFLHLPGLEAASRRYFGGYSEHRFAGRAGGEHELAADLLRTYYGELDAALERSWEGLPEPKLLVVVSAYGIEEPGAFERSWARALGRPTLGGVTRDAPDGMLLLLGRGVRPGTLITEARLVDVAPTLAYGLGLPVARDLDGRVLTEAFAADFLTAHPLTFVPSYETLAAPPEAAPGALNPPSPASAPARPARSAPGAA